jgi:hypothetical protein
MLVLPEVAPEALAICMPKKMMVKNHAQKVQLTHGTYHCS